MSGLTPMAPGGRWMRPVHDAPPVYIPAKQIEAHYKRLVGDGWTPMEDPRSEDVQVAPFRDYREGNISHPVTSSSEVAMQARIDQLEALVMQLLAQKSEHNGSTTDASSTDSQGQDANQRPSRRKPAV